MLVSGAFPSQQGFHRIVEPKGHLEQCRIARQFHRAPDDLACYSNALPGGEVHREALVVVVLQGRELWPLPHLNERSAGRNIDQLCALARGQLQV